MGKVSAIVLSAGVGKRMNSDIPKQYMDMKGYPVIYYSLKAFQDSCVDEIILVTGKEDVDFCRTEIVDQYKLDKVRAIVPGGKERYDSVYEGLKAIGSSDFVLIHDGARPLIDDNIIRRSLECVKENGACVVGMPVKDTIKVSDENGYSIDTPDRSLLWAIQTPQSFEFGLIKEAYEKLYGLIENNVNIPNVTDDAMVVEYVMKKSVKLIEGSYQNIKITTPEDIAIAGLFLENR